MFDYESILRTAWVEIDGTRLRDNIRAVQQRVGSSRIIGVAKANAYGHGAKEVAQYLISCDDSLSNSIFAYFLNVINIVSRPTINSLKLSSARLQTLSLSFL